ncbi:FAD binding domain-containing protein [Suillus americanus]|nr:FAD binding domain-containing protein [Suillus americanus]
MPVPFVRHFEVDVLIIGAGPAGLMCANALANARVKVRIVDQKAVKLTTGEGDGLSPLTVEVFQSYGLGERFLRESCKVHLADTRLIAYQVFYNPSSTGGIELTNRTSNVTAPSARYPFEVALHQGAIQYIFIDSMTPLGVKDERSTIPTSIELSKDENELTDPTSYPVRVVLQRKDKSEDEPREEIVRAKFVVGYDSAHSWIRKQVNITMDGEQSDSIWGVVDMITPDTDFSDIRNKATVHSNHGSDKDLINSLTGRVDKDKMGPEQILETAQRSLMPYELIRKSEFLWWTIYSVGQRVASKFSVKNRVFITGDSCHTHSPKAGMNASINDSHNLAWKIALVVRGWADMPPLPTYESERRKFALDPIAFDKMWTTLFCGKPLTEQNSDGVSPEHFLKTFQADFTSGIGIHYHPSVAETRSWLVVSSSRVPPYKFMRAADAWLFGLQDLLPSDFLFKLLVFTGDFSDPLQQARVESMVTDMQKPESFLNRYATHGNSRFDNITISKGRKGTFGVFLLPALLRSHWSKVFIDDTDPTGSFGGEGYSDYGVGPEGALVAVRPDGYVGAIASLGHVAGLDAYFASFMKIPAEP